MQRYCKKNLRH